jgi:transcriptional regulator with XRE-family HTH domain
LNVTQGAITHVSRQVAGILPRMGDLAALWRDVLAPRLKAQKKAMGRDVPEWRIAKDIQDATGQESSRSLLAMWLRGEREPTVSQFVALCRRLMLDPVEVLASRTYIGAPREPAHNPSERQFVKSRNLDEIPHSKTKTLARVKAHKVSHRK